MVRDIHSKKVLITGSSGMVGSELRMRLLYDHEVHTLDLKDGQDLRDCDLNYDVDIIFHLAGKSGVRRSLTHPEEYWQHNVIASKRLFKTFPKTRIIYASSSTAKEPWRNPYALSKHTIERIAPRRALGLRFTTIYNGDQEPRPDMFIPKLLRRQIEFVNKNHKRDFIHVSDICDALVHLMNKRLTGVFDLGTGKSTKLKDITDHLGLYPKFKIGDKHERLDNRADITKLRSTGWKPTLDIFEYFNERGLQKNA